MTAFSKGFSQYPVGLKLIIGFFLLSSGIALITSKNVFAAAIGLILVIGLLRLNNWAREWSVGLVAIGIIITSIQALFEMAQNRLDNPGCLAFLVNVSLLGLMVSYLRSPAVRELFLVEPSSDSKSNDVSSM